MYQAILQKLADIPAAIPPERLNLEAGQTILIEFASPPKEGRGFFLYNGGKATYTSMIQEVWSPKNPGDSHKIHGIKVPNDLGNDDVVFATENTIYMLRVTLCPEN